MPLKRLCLAAAIASIAGTSGGLAQPATPNELLTRAREAARGSSRPRTVESLEVKGMLTESTVPGATGALAFRIQLPDKIFLVEKLPGRRTYVAALNATGFAARLGDAALASTDDGRRSAERRSSRLLAGYLLHVSGDCRATGTLSELQLSIDASCGGYRLEFEPGTFRLRALSHTITVIKGVTLGPDDVRRAREENVDLLANRPTFKTTVRSEYSDYRNVDGWHIPFREVSSYPDSVRTFSIASVRLNASFAERDFRIGDTPSDLQQWVDSAAR